MPLSLSTDTLGHLWPHAPHSLVDGMAKTSQAVFANYQIATLAELADFMAQGSEETGGGEGIEEALDYTAQRLCQVWPSEFPTIARAIPYTHNPRLLADRVYGARYGNRPGTDDGYNFRGRGFIQVTFRSWYEKLSVITGLDLVAKPDLVNDPDHFLEIGAAFWKIDGINAFADRGDFRGETLRLNGGYTNMPARLAWRSTWRRALGVDSAGQSSIQLPTRAGPSAAGEARVGGPVSPAATKGSTMLLTNALALLGEAPELIGDAESAYAAVQAFIVSSAGKDLEAKLATLFHATTTPGAAVVVEPKATATTAKK